MGIVLEELKLKTLGTVGILKPLVYCNPPKDILAKAISLEDTLVDRLLAIEPKRRSRRIGGCFEATLAELPVGAVLRDIDVLFNPSYAIDVLEMMISACKRRNFSVIWPGKYDSGRLLYAEYGYKDYKEYKITDYDITCIL